MILPKSVLWLFLLFLPSFIIFVQTQTYTAYQTGFLLVTTCPSDQYYDIALLQCSACPSDAIQKVDGNQKLFE